MTTTKVLLDRSTIYHRCSYYKKLATLQEITTIEKFDLLEFQKKARETCDPKKLFDLWEDVCRRYDKHEIGQYDFDEMKDAIWPNLEALAVLRRSINATEAQAPVNFDERKRA